jgi:polyferredoxin
MQLQWQDTATSLRRELKKVKAKVDEFRELYDWFSWGIFPSVVSVFLIGEWNQDNSIKELKKSVAMLKEEKG